MAFHEVRFPTAVSFGSVGGPERRTEIVTLTNGAEERNSPWAHSRRRYDAGLGLRSLDDIEVLVAFFEARRGQLYGFRWKDWSDYKSGLPSQEVAETDQVLGVGDGTETVFHLTKRYGSGAESYTRPIHKPVASTVKVALNGLPQAPGQDYTLDDTTGAVTFLQAPGTGVEVSAGFEFDVPVRFDIDRIDVSIPSFQVGTAPNVPIVEVRV